MNKNGAIFANLRYMNEQWIILRKYDTQKIDWNCVNEEQCLICLDFYIGISYPATLNRMSIFSMVAAKAFTSSVFVTSRTLVSMPAK